MREDARVDQGAAGAEGQVVDVVDDGDVAALVRHGTPVAAEAAHVLRRTIAAAVDVTDIGEVSATTCRQPRVSGRWSSAYSTRICSECIRDAP